MNVIRGLHLERRTMLRGLFGVAIALPLLDAMTPAMAKAAVAARTAPPQRLGFIMFPNGCIKDDWTPKDSGPGYTMSKAFDSLAPNRKKISVLSGLACDPSRTRQGFHDRAVASFLTGVEKSKAELRVSPSVDQVAGLTLGRQTAFRSLELAGEPINSPGGMVYKTATQPLPFETSPRILFERLFGDADRVDPEILLEIRKRQKSMLDYLSSQVSDVRRNLGVADRNKLAEYLDSVRDIERRLDFTQKLATQGVKYERPDDAGDNYARRVNILFDLQSIALQTDMTRVFTFMMNAEASNMTFPDIGWDYSHHQTSHHLFDKTKMRAITKINNYQAGLFNYFLTKLDGMQENDGSVLDHSLIVYGSDLGDANNHMQVDLPIILAGGAAMGVKGDRHLQYAGDVPITNLYTSMLHKIGAPVEKFGDCTGPLDHV